MSTPAISDQIFSEGEQEIAYYGQLPGDYPNKQVIFFEEDSLPKLRRFDSIPISTLTSIAFIKGEIYDLKNLYNTLACLPHFYNFPNEYIEEGTFTSVVWENSHKGENIGYFKNSISTAMWNGIKKVKCKIFKVSKPEDGETVIYHKLQLTGIDIDVAEKTATMIVKQMIESANFYMYIKNNPEEYWAVLEWLIANSEGPEIEEGENRDRHISWPSKIPTEYSLLGYGILRRFTDLCYISQIMPRAIDIFDRPIPCSTDLKIISVKRAMSKYNYSLGFSVDRYELTKYLNDIGYSACFFNQIVDYVYVPISDEIQDFDKTIRRELGRENQFEICEKGKIKHSGTGDLPMHQTYICLMLDIIKGVDRFRIKND